jgi:hypothetical protein
MDGAAASPRETIIPAPIRDAKYIDDLEPWKQDIVHRAMSSEHREGEIPFHVFLFTSARPDGLPPSAWERPSTGAACHATKIAHLAGVIDRDGYSRKKPLLLFGIPVDKERARVSVEGGHHRLQAVRDLMRDKKLPATFKLPCIVFFNHVEKIAAMIGGGQIDELHDLVEKDGLPAAIDPARHF